MITAFGESAGSASLCLQLSSTVPLFNRVILESGTATTIGPASLSKKEAEYRALLTYCGIREVGPQALEKLRAVPVATLVEAATAIMKGAFSPLAHESFFPVIPNYLNHASIVASCPWVDSIMTGDAIFEVSLTRVLPLVMVL